MIRLRLRVLRFLGWSSLLPCSLSNRKFWARAALAFPSERILPVSNEPVHRRRTPFRRGLSRVRRAQGKPELL